MAEKKKSGNTKKSGKTGKARWKRIVFLVILLIIIFAVLCFITPTEAEMEGSFSPSSIPGLEIPQGLNREIVRHTGYTLSYVEEYEVAEWVAYELTREKVTTIATERGDNFRPDKAVSTGSASLNDYKKSGYDRGHLAPAADFRWSEEAMDDTFYLSNMTPQTHAFNAGIWSDLESAVRSMAYADGSIYVVTGPVLTDGPYPTIGENNVAVPNYFYKVILDYSEPVVKAIGFIVPHENSKEPLSSFAVTVDEVERVTGIDFFPLLPDEEEERIESTMDVTLWALRAFSPSSYDTTDAAIYVEGGNGGRSEIEDTLLSLFFSVFYSLKKEVFNALGVSDIARTIGLL